MAFEVSRIGPLVLAASLALAGCSSEEDTASATASPETPATQDEATSQQPAPPPAVEAPPATSTPLPVSNTAPVVSGAPASSATTGESWSFVPSATDADGDAVTWSIAGKPSDATFSTASGQLAWTPSGSGAWNDIVITATDARGASTSLPAFSVVVNAPQQVTGSATLSWDMPQQYTDGVPLAAGDAVVGYRVYHGTSADALDQVIPVNEPTQLQYAASDLPAGTHYFAVAAISVNGAEGARSEVLSKTVM